MGAISKLLSAGPVAYALFEKLQERYPKIFSRATAMFATAGGGALLATMLNAHEKGDANTLQAGYETLIRAGLDRGQLMAMIPNMNEDDMHELFGHIERVNRKDRSNSDKNVDDQGTSLDVLTTKAVQLSRIQRFLGLTADEIMEVITFFNTTTSEQLRLVEQMRLATLGVRP